MATTIKTWLDTLDDAQLMVSYGLYADAKVQIDEMPARYDDWLVMERAIANALNDETEQQ